MLAWTRVLAIAVVATSASAQSLLTVPIFPPVEPPGGVDGIGTGARFHQPAGVAIDAGGTLYVADGITRTIRRVTAGGVVTTLAGLAYHAGHRDGVGPQARFERPTAIALEASGSLLVADAGDQCLRRVTSAGVVTTVAGVPGVSGAGNGPALSSTFSAPRALGIDAGGAIYVMDLRAVRRVAGNPLQVVTVASTAENLVGMVVDRTTGFVFVMDVTGTLLGVNPATSPATVTTLAAHPRGCRAIDGPLSGACFAASATWEWPIGMAIAPAERTLVIADHDGSVLRSVSLRDGVVSTLGLGHTGRSEDGIGLRASVWHPSGLVIDALGNVYFTEDTNTVRVVSSALQVRTLAGVASAPAAGPVDGPAGTGRLSKPTAAALGPDGALYVLDGSTVRRVGSAGEVTTLAGSPTEAGTADGDGAQARFSPWGHLAVAPDGTIYVSQPYVATIRRITRTGTVTTLAGLASQFGGTNGQGASARFAEPSGIAVDRRGTLYVADATTIRTVTPTGLVSTLAGKFQEWGSADGVGAAARFAYATDVAVDEAGTLYVADSSNSTIRRVTQAGVVTTLAGTVGAAGCTDGSRSTARLNGPTALGVDAAGQVFVHEYSCGTVRRILPDGSVNAVTGWIGRNHDLTMMPGGDLLVSTDYSETEGRILHGTIGPLRTEQLTATDVPAYLTTDVPLTVSDARGVVESVEVRLHIVQKTIGALHVSLVGPDGTSTMLVSSVGDASASTLGRACFDSELLTLSDAATTAVSAQGSAPWAGVFRPVQPLSAFAGLSGAAVNGTWKLRVSSESAVPGVVACWSLDIHQRAPAITAIDPPFGPTSAAVPQSVTIHGVQFGAPTDPLPEVRVGGRLAPVLERAPDGTRLVVQVQNAFAPGLVAVAITKGDGMVTVAPGAYGYIDPPTVSSLSATTGPRAGGTSTTIRGTNFVAGFTAVYFGTALAPAITVTSPTTMEVVTPPGPLGPVTVSVFTHGGQAYSAFTYTTQLTVNRAGLGVGTVVGGPITCGTTCSAVYATADVVTLAAQAGVDSRFAGWTGACAGTGTCQVTMADARSVTATFDLSGVTVNQGSGGHRVSIDTAGGTVVVSLNDVTRAGAVDASATCTTPTGALPTGYRFTPGCVFDLHTHGALSFVTADVCLPYDATAVGGAGLVPAVLGLASRGAGNAWIRVDSRLTSDGREVCSSVPTLGVFALVAPTNFPRYLAEGATSTFFDMRLALLNPTTRSSAATLSFQKPGGDVVTRAVPVPAMTRVTFDPKQVTGLETAEFSTATDSDSVLVVDRLLTWDATTAYGAHAETAVLAPATTWYLAEGATHSGFDLFYLLQNPDARDAAVTVRFLRPAGAPLEKRFNLPPQSRTNIWVNVEPFEGLGMALASTDVSAVVSVTNGVPIIVERALYLSRPGQLFAAGHDSAGVNAPATRWFLAEGATGSFFDLFVLIANPTDRAAAVEAMYLLPNGSTLTKSYTVDPTSRFNIWVDLEDPRLADTAVSTTITSTNGVPVIVERALWWPSGAWHEAHNSPGATSTGTRWAVAEGEVGGPRARDTYLLVANTSPTAGTVTVTLVFEDGTTAVRTFGLAPNSRFNVDARVEFPASIDRRFGAIVESTGDVPAQIVVESSIYWSVPGQVWAAGTNALATRIR